MASAITAGPVIKAVNPATAEPLGDVTVVTVDIGAVRIVWSAVI